MQVKERRGACLDSALISHAACCVWLGLSAGHIETEFQLFYGDEAVSIERVWYATSQEVFEGLISGEVHITEPYFVLSAFFNGKPRQEVFRSSCITAG